MSEVKPLTDDDLKSVANYVAEQEEGLHGLPLVLGNGTPINRLLATIEAYKAEVEGARRARVSAEQDTAIMAHNLHTAHERLEHLEAYITEEVGDPLPAPTGGE